MYSPDFAQWKWDVLPGRTRQNDDASGRICLQLFGVELIAQTDVENAGDYCIDTILGVSVWHQLNAVRYSDPDRVGNAAKGFQWMSSGRTDLKTSWPG